MLEMYCAYTILEKINEIKTFPKNINKHPKEQVKLLAKVLTAHGWRVPLTVSLLSGYLVRGHGRFLAAKFLGETEVPVDYQKYSSIAEEDADRVADNEIARLAERDDKLLAELITEMDDGDFDLSLLGLDEEDLYSFLEDSIEVFESKGAIGNRNYGNASGSKIPINILGIGGMIDGVLMEKVKGKLCDNGASEELDNGKQLADIFKKWISE